MKSWFRIVLMKNVNDPRAHLQILFLFVQLPTLLVPMALLEISIVLFLNILGDTLCHFLEDIL